MTGVVATNSQAMNPQAYQEFCQYLQQSCGITLGNDKSYLVNSRLKPILDEYSLSSLSDLLLELKKHASRSLQTRIIDAMTTNETSWFRDNYPFDLLKEKILPEFSRQSSLSIWSAACSYGHEPYSISIAVEEYLQKNPGQYSAGINILGTDISSQVLAQAQTGDYDELNLTRGLSIERKQQYFSKSDKGMQVNSKIRQRVRFRELNLLKSFATVGQMDIIFCRNVLIYFTNENKSEILNKIASVIKPGGYVFLGASEPIVNYSNDFEMITARRGVVYRKK